MCTALTFKTRDHYFGRNLDLEYSYRETVTITPRNFPLPLRNLPTLSRHQAILGMAYVHSGYPLYYDAVNESGLAMAALNFPGNARYFPPDNTRCNVCSFELIPWLLGRCEDLQEVCGLLENVNICNLPFSPELSLTPLHWIISDKTRSITLESTEDGLKIYDNIPGILTNNPPFPYHLLYLSCFTALQPGQPQNHLHLMPELSPFSRGMGTMGLPGDFSSPSRFVRTAYLKSNAQCDGTEIGSVNQFFHILDNVAHPRGAVEVSPEQYQTTVYSSCCNMDKGIYYYKTYENSTITAVELHREDLESGNLISYPLAASVFPVQNKK